VSRSRKKNPIIPTTTCESEKKDKKRARRRLRRKQERAVAAGDETVPVKQEVSEVWDFGKDGKGWYPDDPKLLRK
jgi:hypothetical protein